MPTISGVARCGPVTSTPAGSPAGPQGAAPRAGGQPGASDRPGFAAPGASDRPGVAAPGASDRPGVAAPCASDRPGFAAPCAVGRPGVAAGGCSFDGAMITLAPVTDVAHLVHGPIGCAGNSWQFRGSRSSGPLVYRHGVTTSLTETDIVGGGERRLSEAIDEVAARLRPAAIFVYATCVPAMIGDDLPAVCRAAAQRLGLPVIAVPAPGFAGSKNTGNIIAGRVLLDQVIGTAEPAVTTPGDVNLLGEYNIAGELWSVGPVLARLGIRVLTCVSGDARYRELTVAHRARATMVVCSRALLDLARGLADRYRIPWFEGSFYGLRAMRDTLTNFARLLGTGDHAEPPRWSTTRAEAVIAAEEARVSLALAGVRERISGARAVLYTGGVKSWSMVSALQDLGVEVVASGATKSTPGDVQRIRSLIGNDGLVITEASPAHLLRVVQDTGADLLIAGGRNQYTALKAKIPFLDVNQEREHGYAGYEGIVRLARELDRELHNPVWSVVRAPAPWQRRRAESTHREAGAPGGGPGGAPGGGPWLG